MSPLTRTTEEPEMNAMQPTSPTASRPIGQSDAPVYPSGQSRMPRPMLLEPVVVDVALARLMGATPPCPLGQLSGHGTRRRCDAEDAGWDWMDTSMSGVEVTEHPLPEGLDFAAFHALLRLAH
jgi:hypothetical protein